MAVCTFFGHRECPESIKPALKSCLAELIEREGVECFYVGEQGKFDSLVRGTLRELCEQYPHIRCTTVLAYLPQKQTEDDTLFPSVLESVPYRYAIDRRNRWMLERADIVVVYVTHSWGGAAKFEQMAQRRGKKTINIAE